jgi:hypothetical protein
LSLVVTVVVAVYDDISSFSIIPYNIENYDAYKQLIFQFFIPKWFYTLEDFK